VTDHPIECLAIGCGRAATGRDQLCGLHRDGGGYLPGETLHLNDPTTGLTIAVFLPIIPIGPALTLVRDHIDGRSSWLGEFTSMAKARAWVCSGWLEITPDTECISGFTRLVDPAAAEPWPRPGAR